MSNQYINVQRDDRVATITLDRPKALNALCSPMMIELESAIVELDQDTTIGAIIITGNEKAFAAGADIKEMQGKTHMEAYVENFITDHWDAVSNCRTPVIAAVRGFALGGGCELAMMCDFIVAADNARFGQPEINLGIIPGAGGTQRLPRLIGRAKAMELCLTGRLIDAAEAEKIGLVARVFSEDELMAEANKIAKAIASKSLPSVFACKEMVNRAEQSSLAEGLLFERRTFHSLFDTEDKKEGMLAFIEKRKPQWQHR